MSDFKERSVQDGLAEKIAGLGWVGSPDVNLGRAEESVFIVSDLEAALVRLNPEIAERPDRASEVLARLRAVLLGVRNDGLVSSNEEFVQWMCGRRTVKYIGTEKDAQVRLIDFDNLRANTLRVTEMRNYTAIQIAENTYLSAEFAVTVYA
jgi:type I restriction enzyme R subunit